MPKKKPITEDIQNTKSSMSLSIREVVYLIAMVVSIVMAWGLFGTRVTVVEERIIFINDNIKDIKTIINDIRTDEKKTVEKYDGKLKIIEDRLHTVETRQAELKILLERD